jgi:hypothetical protein
LLLVAAKGHLILFWSRFIIALNISGFTAVGLEQSRKAVIALPICKSNLAIQLS